LDDSLLKMKHDQELQRLRQKQRDEWLALLEFQSRERDPVWGQRPLQAQPTIGSHQLNPRLTPAESEIFHPSKEINVIEISSDNEESSTSSSRSPSSSARTPKERVIHQNKALRSAGREKLLVSLSRRRFSHYADCLNVQQAVSPIKPANGRRMEEHIDTAKKRQHAVPKSNNAVGQCQKELGKVRATAAQPVDKPQPIIDTPFNLTRTKTNGPPVLPRTQTRKAPLDRDSSPDIPLRVLPRAQSRKPLLDRDSSPEIPLRVLRKQQNDRSSILKDPKKVARDPQLLALQQKKEDGLFGKDILRNDRSQSWAPGLGSVFQAPCRSSPLCTIQPANADGNRKPLMIIKCRPERLRATIQLATTKKRQRAFMSTQAKRAAVELGVTAIPSTPYRLDGSSNHATTSQQAANLLSRLDSSTKLAKTSNETGAAFSFEISPRSASQFTSSRDALASIRERRERESSVASKFSTVSHTTSIPTPRKRKKAVSLSDGSDCDPTEPPSPEAKTKTVAPKQRAAIKNVQVKNEDDFKVPQTPPSKLDRRGKPSTPNGPVAKKQKFVPRSPESPSLRPSLAMSSRKFTTSPRTGSRLGGRLQPRSSVRPMRGAAAQANQKFQDLAEGDKYFYTNEAKLEAEKEENKYTTPKPRNKEQLDAIGKRFRNMSMTPDPSTVQESEYEDDGEDMEDWISERLSGDRHVAKRKALEIETEYDSLDEDVVNQHRWVNGVIVQVGGGDQEMADV
jgi:hypothetical protein